jgi:hypothetical protein
MTLLAPSMQAWLSELADYVELGARLLNVSEDRTIWSA